MLRLAFDAVPINQRKANTGIIRRNPCAACRLARKNSSTAGNIDNRWRKSARAVQFFVAIHREIKPVCFWEKRNSAHQSAKGYDNAAVEYCRQFRQSAVNEEGT
jgi:hypothetical protein